MRYISTRGKAADEVRGPGSGFREVLLGGLAPDGGLYVPEEWPRIDLPIEEIPFPELSAQVLKPYVGNYFDKEKLKQLTEKAYSSFTHPDVVPLTYVEELDFYMLELFHGPTLSFKDVALQLIGTLFEEVLEKEERKATVLTATSGDTGAAAIHTCLGRNNLNAFVLHPKGLVSEIQRRMMTCVSAPNIKNIAIEGNFDDCQKLVKGLFNELNSDLDRLNLVAMNSINWMRIAAQSVYYSFIISRLPEHEHDAVFFVPSGNFGNIYSGWVAKETGIPIHKLIAAVNTNDTLEKFFKEGKLDPTSRTCPSLAPAMDVSIPSNLERLIFEINGRAGTKTRELYSSLDQGRALQFELGDEISSLWDSHSVIDEEIRFIIKEVKEKAGMWIDPHTAVGVSALLKAREADPGLKDHPQVVLSTAHPAKFEDLYTGEDDPPQLPENFADLKSRPEEYEVLPNDFETVKDYILKTAK